MNKFSLEKHPKITNGFTVPTGYFENFSENILEKTIKTEPKKGTLFTLKNLSYAAAAVLVIGLSIPFLMTKQVVTLDQIDTVTLENYISYQSNVSTYEIMNLMDDEALNTMHVNLALEDQFVEDILTSNPNFENYIID